MIRPRRRAVGLLALSGLVLLGALGCTSAEPEADSASPSGSPSSPTGPPATSATSAVRVITEPVEVTMEVDPGLPGHTVYRPTDLDAAGTLPIVVVGEGACQLPGDAYAGLLTEIAGHGYLVVADREPGQPGPDTPELLTEGLDWAVGEATRPGSPYEGRLDTSAVATAGHSCGGLLALHVGATDERVTSVLAWDSGIFDAGAMGGATKADLELLHGPTMWMNAGPLDIAYPQAEKDYAAVPDDVPAMFANYDLGDRGGGLTGAHVGTLFEPGGGEQGRVSLLWLDLTLKGSEAAAEQLLDPPCRLCDEPRWTVESKNWD